MEYRFERGDLVFLAEPDMGRFRVRLGEAEFLLCRTPSVLFSDGVEAAFPAPSSVELLRSGTNDTLRILYDGIGGRGISALCHAGMERASGDVLFSVSVTGDAPGQLLEVRYPTPFEFDAAPGHGYTVLPLKQGTLIPAGDEIPFRRGRIFQGDAYMPIFGQWTDGAGYTAIYETPYDALYRSDGRQISPAWRTSLGTMRYERRIRYVFRAPYDHNVTAACYREYLKERGMLVTLAEKALRNPRVRELAGLPVIHTEIAWQISPDSRHYDREHPEKNRFCVPFARRAEQLRRLKELGLERAYTHFDGWGLHGYDNLHPSPFPPNEEAGGADGMRALSDTCRELGYLFGVHDQYRDYFYDGPDFSFDQAVMNPDGSHPFNSEWYGGKQSFLCSALAPAYVRRNYDEFRRLGIGIDAAYLDVFSIVDLDECFSPDHTCTREECAKNRRICLDLLTARGILPSSEEAVDCILPSMVLCHHAPFYNGDSGAPDLDAIGIPIPLLELVYHDCLIVPWIGLPGERGGFGIPKNDSAYLYAILFGCPVYCPVDADAKTVEDVKTACALAGRLAFTPMVRHEFVDGDIRRQRTLFADGTAVEADLDAGTWSVRPGDSKA